MSSAIVVRVYLDFKVKCEEVRCWSVMLFSSLNGTFSNNPSVSHHWFISQAPEPNV